MSPLMAADWSRQANQESFNLWRRGGQAGRRAGGPAATAGAASRGRSPPHGGALSDAELQHHRFLRRLLGLPVPTLLAEAAAGEMPL